MGTVTTPAADGQPSVMPGVTMTLSCTGTVETAPRVGVSDGQGAFEFTEVPAGVCSLVAELQGFKTVTKTLTITANHQTEAPMRLELDTLREEVNVAGSVNEAQGDSPELAVLDHTGHIPAVENEVEFDRVLVEFLSRHRLLTP